MMVPVNTNGASPLLVVGLGNPGADYEGTRHNIGAAVLDELGDHFSVNKKVNAHVDEIRVGDRKVVLAKPRSFMNLSGGPVKALAGYFKVKPAQVVVIHDELDLDLGTVKLKKGGGLNGHNGLKDIAAQLGTNDFWRLRLGVGHPGDRSAVVNYVLHPPLRDEMQQIEYAMDDSTLVLPQLLEGKFEEAMLKLHTKTS